MDDISGYDFVDCLVVRFSIGEHLNCVNLWLEAYFPQLPAELRRRRGLLHIQLECITRLEVWAGNGFWDDLEKPYGPAGTMKANEVGSVRGTRTIDGFIEFDLASDMLRLVVVCGSFRIEEMPGELSAAPDNRQMP